MTHERKREMKERKQFHVLCKRSSFKSVCVIFNENPDWDKDLVRLEKRC